VIEQLRSYLMTDQEINQYIHEAMGLCWHEYQGICLGREREDTQGCCCEGVKCKHCGITYHADNPNYLLHSSDWSAMIQWAVEQEWWDEFMKELTRPQHNLPYQVIMITVDLFANSRSLAEHIVEYRRKDAK